MPIDVLYEGVALARGTKMVATPQGTFVEMEAPMPVGTVLMLAETDTNVPVRVERVHEGVGPGVFIVPIATQATQPQQPTTPLVVAQSEKARSDEHTRVTVRMRADDDHHPTVRVPTLTDEPSLDGKTTEMAIVAPPDDDDAPELTITHETSGRISEEMPAVDNTEPMTIEAPPHGETGLLRDPAESGGKKGKKRSRSRKNTHS